MVVWYIVIIGVSLANYLFIYVLHLMSVSNSYLYIVYNIYLDIII